MTLYIDKNETNALTFTLNESATLPLFILQVVSKATQESKLMWLNTDISINTARFNKYIVEEVDTDDEDLEDQKINLIIGSHDFFVWQTEEAVLSIEDLSVSDIIESGKLIVRGEAQVINTFDSPNVKHVYKR